MEKISCDQKKMGSLLAGHLSDKGMTQKELADKVGVKSASISSIVNGRTFPSMTLFMQILDVLEITPNRFFQLPGEMEAPKVVEKIVKVPVPTEQIVYRDREPEESEWIEDARHILYCRCCRGDAPYVDIGVQHRTKFCPSCGRRMLTKKDKREMEASENEI